MSATPFPLTITILLVMAFWGCDRTDDYDKELKTTSLTASSFHGSADGKLTERQVADYIVIRQKIISDVKAQKRVKNMPIDEYNDDEYSRLDFRHYDEIEKASAASFNMSYEEFLWIKDKVITAQTQLLVQQYYDLNNRIMKLLDQTLTRYKEVTTEELERREQQIMNGYVAEMKQEMTGLRDKISDSKERSTALKHNIALVAKFKNELDALQRQALQSVTP